jgi:PAS domain-containing protein
LQHTVLLLNATLDSTADGILVVSNGRKVTSCNEKFVEMWRFGCDSVIGRNSDTLRVEVADQLQSPDDFVARISARQQACR